MTIPKPGDELTLRNGWPAKVLAVHPGQEWPIIGEFFNEHIHQWQSANWNKVGDNSRFPAFDLILPEPERLVLKGWVNVYPGCLQGPFKSEDSARTHRQPHCEACLYIDRPYEEGEGL